MGTFFDPGNPDDQNLLHSSVRDHDELYTVADKVEWEILDHFSQRDMQSIGTYSAFFEYENGSDPDRKIKVRLYGYDQDTPADSRQDLKEALRRTIADVTSYILRNYNNAPGVQSKSQGRRSWATNNTFPTVDEWPDGWAAKLKNFNARIPQYGI